jgi:succinoglycan biosynthesis protein ExoA
VRLKIGDKILMHDKHPVPSVTVMLPIRNEEAYIRRSLGSVLAQEYPAGQMEILVVDGMSTDGTREIVQTLKDGQGRFPVILVDNPKQIPTAALNLGLSLATGAIIIRVDGHCEIAPDYVRCCVPHLQKGRADAVGGAMETVGTTLTAQAIAAAMSTPFGVGNSEFRISSGKEMYTDSVPFPAYRRDTLLDLGGYDEEMLCNEDDELNYRLLKKGGRILMAADIKSRYYSRSSFRSLWKQYFRYGLWKVRVLQKHPRQMRITQFVPFLFVSLLLVSAVLALIPALRPWSILVPLAYLAADLAASMWTAARAGWKYLPLFPLIYATLHLSYGLGFLLGLIKFADRWRDTHGDLPFSVSPDARTS